MHFLSELIAKSKSLKFLYLGLTASIVLVTILPTQRRLSAIEDFNKILSQRLSKVEGMDRENIIKLKSNKNKDFSIYIKSLTFRLGSEDDRLRIYWSDGEKTDLPCTEDENIWACG
ncbi:hypothetical protein [Prochlorococcus marinus]|nr:hypothetical protein [Prochlorococcus marinus]